MKVIINTPKLLIITIGIPASGKSTFCERLLHDFVRINLDTLKTRNREMTAFNNAIDKGCSIVVDNTNVMKSERKVYIDIANKNGYSIYGLFFQSRVKDCIARNEQREGKARISPQAIAAKSNQLELPELAEGFEKLFYVEMNDDSFSISDWNNN